MRRSLVALLLVLPLAGCSFHRTGETLPPDFSYAFVVDGRVAKTVPASAQAGIVSVVLRPRSGESPIWQKHGASYAYLEMEAQVERTTATGGSTIEVRGEVAYYRDLKYTTVNGNDEVERGRPIVREDVEPVTITVEPGMPVNVPLVEGISVLVSVLPKQPAPQP